ncbi:MAG: HD domain-containing protein [Desulfobacterales bacterium]
MIDRHSERHSSIPTPFAPDHAEHCRDAGDMIADVRSVAAAFFVGARGSHDWDHTRRVCRLCDRMAAAEQADIDVVRVAALLHDIGRARQDASNGSICHAREGARLAGPIVENLPLSGRQKKNVLHCISTHRFRGHRAPETLEAKVLFDADKLDAIGAIGVARAFLFAGEVGARLHNPDVRIESTQPYTADDTGYREYRVKLCKIRDRMVTATGRQLAEARHRFMEAYFERFLQEYDGKG